MIALFYFKMIMCINVKIFILGIPTAQDSPP